MRRTRGCSGCSSCPCAMTAPPIRLVSYESRWNAQPQRFDGARCERQGALLRVRRTLGRRFALGRVYRLLDLRDFTRRLSRTLGLAALELQVRLHRIARIPEAQLAQSL